MPTQILQRTCLTRTCCYKRVWVTCRSLSSLWASANIIEISQHKWQRVPVLQPLNPTPGSEESSSWPWQMALGVKRVNVHVWPKIQLLKQNHPRAIPFGMFWTIKISEQHMTSEKPVSFGLATGGKTGYSRLLKWYTFIMCATSFVLVAS